METTGPDPFVISTTISANMINTALTMHGYADIVGFGLLNCAVVEVVDFDRV
jgi:hypothetical protein